MRGQVEIERENRELRNRLTRMYEASLRINESLELGEVLQGVLDRAVSLTGASYALITTLDQSGKIEDCRISGMDSDESQRLLDMPEGPRLFEYFSSLSDSIRDNDFSDHTRSVGLPGFIMPIQISSFIAAPIRHGGETVGHIHVGKKELGKEFTSQDEETLVMFATLAALVIVNARKHRDERRVRGDLEALVETSPVGVAVFALGEEMSPSFNRETARIIGSLRTPGRSVEQLLEVVTIRRDDGREISLQDLTLAQALSSGESFRAEEVTLHVPDGRSVTVLMNATSILSESGELESTVVTLQDLSPLEETERLRAEFLGIVSHELRTPLTSIRGSATSMLDATDELDPAEVRQFLRIIVEQADNMHDLIRDLLDVARIETGMLSVNPEPVEVGTLVDRARNTFLRGDGDFKLEIEIEPNLPMVMADRRRIVQVVGNLLSNAARQSIKGTVIRITAQGKGVQVEFSVTDEGRGIPANRLPDLFRKFSNDGREDQGTDTGLGLPICKGIIEAHGGRIWAESEGSGLGARFAFTLPATPTLASALPTPTQRLNDDGNGGERILVVDDDPDTLRYVRKTLAGAGYTTFVAADPLEASSLLDEKRPHLVLLDLMLPGTDGIDFMKDFQKEHDVPVIFISGYGQDNVVAHAFDSGASDYIVKPFSPTELVARIGASLRDRAGNSSRNPLKPYVSGELSIDYSRRLVKIGGRTARLTAIEYALIRELSVNEGRVVTHDQLIRRVWGRNASGGVATLRTHVARARRKLGDNGSEPEYLFSEPQVGYRMAKSD